MKFDKSKFKRKGGAPALTFEQHGDGGLGVITDMADVEDEFAKNKGEQVFRITGYGSMTVDGETTEDTEWSFYVRTAGQNDAMADAVPEDGIDVGGQLEIRYTGDKQLRNGKAMKLYTAKYVAEGF